MLSHCLSEIILKDPSDDTVTLAEYHSWEKLHNHRKLLISKLPVSESNLNTDKKVGSNPFPDEIWFSLEDAQNKPKDGKLCSTISSPNLVLQLVFLSHNLSATL